MKELTARQQAVLEFIEKYARRNGYTPTLRDIAEGMNVKWTHGIEKHVAALEKKGYLHRAAGRLKRTLRLAHDRAREGTPILGRIAAGAPILAVENIEGTLQLDPALTQGGEHFLLRVAGMSMKDAGIHDADLVLVRRQPTAESGEIVAALLNDEATVKRLRKSAGRIILEPENEAFAPIPVRPGDEFMILGRVILSLKVFDTAVIKNVLGRK